MHQQSCLATLTNAGQQPHRRRTQGGGGNVAAAQSMLWHNKCWRKGKGEGRPTQPRLRRGASCSRYRKAPPAMGWTSWVGTGQPARTRCMCGPGGHAPAPRRDSVMWSRTKTNNGHEYIQCKPSGSNIGLSHINRQCTVSYSWAQHHTSSVTPHNTFARSWLSCTQ